MPILSHVARRHPAQITARVLVYLFLSLGALAIIYPVLLVFGQATSNEFDLRDNAIAPYYLFDHNDLALKYTYSLSPKKLHLMASRHQRNRWTSQIGMRSDTSYSRQIEARFAAQGLSLEAWPTILADLNSFKERQRPADMLAAEFRLEDYYRPFLHQYYGQQADTLQQLLAAGAPVPTWLVRNFPDRAQVAALLTQRDRLGTAIMNQQLRTDYLNYYSVEILPAGNFTVPVWALGDDPKQQMWHQFLKHLPPQRKLLISSDTYWHDFLQKKYLTIAALNQAWGTAYEGFYQLTVPLVPPAATQLRRDWDQFIVERWPRRLLQVPLEYAAQWQSFVRQRLLGKIPEGSADPEAQALNLLSYTTSRAYTHWAQLDLPSHRPDHPLLGRYWSEFTFSGAVPANAFILMAPELGFRRFLQERYGQIGQLNKAWQGHFASFDQIPLPLAYADYIPAYTQHWRLRWSFASESFVRLLEYILGRGKAAQNTIILVLLSLVAALTINPLAAYALSRFPMQQTHKVLLFFLATMAFPAEVAMIPNFLLLRDLGLLNTYAALIIPGMANGFSIFLLKAFFDSLPKELYEAAELDGAAEVQIFRLVALPILVPILAYIGLSTFVAAYSGFLWAFVICPSEEMWTLMVWVYDFQSRNPGNNFVMAATILVSIPPLIVFLFANKLIMRGIMIPSMK